jgi:hypothetical protein
MPVGTHVAIATDEGIAFEATVVSIHEQVGGSDKTPGMLLKPELAADSSAAIAWWKERVSLPDLSPPKSANPKQPPPTPVVVVSKRVTKPGIGVPELLDDGQDTGVMDAIDPDALEEVDAKLVDDGHRTIAMQAVDLAALGLEPATAAATAAPSDDDANGNGNGGNGRADSEADNKPDGKSRKKRKKR